MEDRYRSLPTGLGESMEKSVNIRSKQVPVIEKKKENDNKKVTWKDRFFPTSNKVVDFREADRVRFYLLVCILVHVIFLTFEFTMYSNVDFMMCKEVLMIYISFVCF
jgi:hypothetical protein